MSETDCTGYVIEKGQAVVFNKDEYQMLLEGDYMPRVTAGHGEEQILGFYVVVDSVIEMIEFDMDELLTDTKDHSIFTSILEKLKPLSGKSIFIP